MRRKTSGRITGALAALTLVIAAFSAQATTFSTINATDGNWTDAAHWSVAGVPFDTVGTADRINLTHACTTILGTAANLGSTDFIVHGGGTLQINTGGSVSLAIYSLQNKSTSATLIMNGGTLTTLSTSAGGSRLGQDTDGATTGIFTSYVQMVSGTVTFGASSYAAYGGATTMYTQSGGTFNSSAKDLTMVASTEVSLFDATISGGTFKVGNWSLAGGASDAISMTIDGSGQDLVSWGNLNGSAGNILNLNFNLDSGWDAVNGQIALGALDLSADTATVNVDLGTYNATVGQIIVLASGTAYGESRTAAINTTGVTFNSLTDGVTFNDVSDASGLKIQITSIPEPATIGMLGLGALVTILLRRMRTR